MVSFSNYQASGKIAGCGPTMNWMEEVFYGWEEQLRSQWIPPGMNPNYGNYWGQNLISLFESNAKKGGHTFYSFMTWGVVLSFLSNRSLTRTIHQFIITEFT